MVSEIERMIGMTEGDRGGIPTIIFGYIKWDETVYFCRVMNRIHRPLDKTIDLLLTDTLPLKEKINITICKKYKPE